MPPIRAVKNQYRGINAHLHSYWQAKSGWDSFHTAHIVFLAAALKAKLLPLGYTTDIEQSLQIRRGDLPAGRPKSDVTIYDTQPTRLRQSSSTGSISAPVITPIPEIVDDIEEIAPYRALAIYKYEENRSERGEPIAWVELLSPSNKPGGQDDFHYNTKRWKLIHSGMVFVEIDYLHESPSTFDRLPRYATGQKRGQPEPDSHPYRIIVVDPRPVFIEGLAYPHSFDVDDPIPTVEIPLNGEDILRFDFGAAYNKTFEETLYGARLVDYSQLPLNFDRYSEDDQRRIVCRMLAVLNAAREGVDLESNGPLPVEPLSFEEGLTQLQLV